MLAAAKPDFQPQWLACRDLLHVEQAPLGIIRAGDPGDAELGQVFLQVTLLRSIERFAFDAPIKISMFHGQSFTKKGAPKRTQFVSDQGPLARPCAYTAFFSASTRSVFSQLKPPSASGARPKCP